MLLRAATPSDLAAIVAIERLPESQKYVGQWSEERHRATLAGGDARYFVSEDEAGAVQAYAILRGFADGPHNIELKRIVAAAPGHGLGRWMLNEILRLAFNEFHAHRVFLDVFEDNHRAQHLYESAGFVYEGTMREAAMRGGKYCTLRLMSLLESEYRARAPAAVPSTV